jgi:hypothetical protein
MYWLKTPGGEKEVTICIIAAKDRNAMCYCNIVRATVNGGGMLIELDRRILIRQGC